MMRVEEIRKELSDKILKRVSESTGLHYNTVRYIANGTNDPSYKSASILSEYLSKGTEKS